MARPFSSLWNNRNLILQLGIRETWQRFRSSKLGLTWIVLQPLATVATFYYVFSVVFRNTWKRPDEPGGEFILALFAGFLVFNLFSEIVSKSPTLITGNQNFVKKLVFPLDVLPASAAISALISTLVSTLVWLAAFIYVRGTLPSLSFLLLPVLLFPVLLLSIGISWIISAICTYFRDVSHAVPLILQALVFLSPVLYPSSRVPQGLVRAIMNLNPLQAPIELTRGALLDGQVPHWGMYLSNLMGAVLIFQLGYILFQKLRPGFADVV